MNSYETIIFKELKAWELKMAKKPSLANRLTKKMQTKVNGLIPAKAHAAITIAIKNMVKAVLFGSEFTNIKPLALASLQERERLVKEKINFYKKTSAISGAGTGAGGILLGLADLPILLSLKIKFLYDVSALYGFDVRDFKERLYLLYIFQLAFSSQEKRNEVYRQIVGWDQKVAELPADLNSFDWLGFQQEYRDYIDLAKMLQLVPVIGAVVGAYANYRLLDQLGETAMNAYRMRKI
ncbi:MAG: EcsC family protein [Bacillota bacterium]|nr:EcsC family protein [Bacillota bacterium]